MNIFPTAVEARQRSSHRNRLFPERQVLNENRPLNRNHPYGGTLVVGVHTKPTIINPIFTTQSISAPLMELIFDSLVRIDGHGKIIPGLAQSWDISEDGLVYTFYLREGIRFHDGVELTAQDVKFTYDQIHNPANDSPWRSDTEAIEKWVIIDQKTLQMILKEPFVPILYKLLREIVPKHLLKGKNLQTDVFNDHPIGTGSFIFKSWDKETNTIELEANLKYFEGRPYLNKMMIKTYSDVEQVWAAFMRGKIDLVHWISDRDYAIIKDDPQFKTYIISLPMYYALRFNTRDSIWRDRELRRAIAYGINKREIMRMFSEFGGIECTGPFHPDSIGFNKEVRALEYNPVKAKMMFMHRGWQDGPQGIRQKHKKDLEVKILVDERNAVYRDIVKAIRQQLSEIGVRVVILFYQDESELTKEFLKEYNPQAWLRLFSGLGTDVNAVLESWYSLSSQFGNLWNYKNKDIDDLFELGNIMEKEGDQQDIYQKIYQIIYEDQPASFLFFPRYYSAIGSNFKNTDDYFGLFNLTYTIKNWYVFEN